MKDQTRSAVAPIPGDEVAGNYESTRKETTGTAHTPLKDIVQAVCAGAVQDDRRATATATATGGTNAARVQATRCAAAARTAITRTTDAQADGSGRTAGTCTGGTVDRACQSGASRLSVGCADAA
ncbi:hypothetical protein [Xanthobacter sediminis]